MTKKLFSGVAVEDIEGTMTADLPDLSVSNAQQAAEDTAVKQNGDFADDEMFAEATAEVGITKDAVAKEDGEEAEEAPSEVPADADPEVAEEAAAAATTEAPVVAEEVTETVAEGETTDADATAEAGEAAEPDEMDEEITEVAASETSIDDDLTEAVSAQEEQDETIEMVEDASEKAASLEEFLDTVSRTRVKGGLDACGANIARFTLESFATSLDLPIKELGLPSQESFEDGFSTYLGRGTATEGFVDTIKALLEKVMKAIKIAIDNSIAFGKKVIVMLFGSRGKLIKKAEAIATVAKEAQKDAKLLRKQVGGGFVNQALRTATKEYTGVEASELMSKATDVLVSSWQPEKYAADFTKTSETLFRTLKDAFGAGVTFENYEAALQKFVDLSKAEQKPLANARLMSKEFISDKLKIDIPTVEGDVDAFVVYSDGVVLPGSKMLVTFVPNFAAVKDSIAGTDLSKYYQHKLVDVKRPEYSDQQALTLSHSEIIKVAENVKNSVSKLDDILKKFKALDTARIKMRATLFVLDSKSLININEEAPTDNGIDKPVKIIRAGANAIRAQINNVDKPASDFSKHTILVGNQLLTYCGASLKAYENNESVTAKIKQLFNDAKEVASEKINSIKGSEKAEA